MCSTNEESKNSRVIRSVVDDVQPDGMLDESKSGHGVVARLLDEGEIGVTFGRLGIVEPNASFRDDESLSNRPNRRVQIQLRLRSHSFDVLDNFLLQLRSTRFPLLLGHLRHRLDDLVRVGELALTDGEELLIDDSEAVRFRCSDRMQRSVDLLVHRQSVVRRILTRLEISFAERCPPSRESRIASNRLSKQNLGMIIASARDGLTLWVLYLTTGMRLRTSSG